MQLYTRFSYENIFPGLQTLMWKLSVSEPAWPAAELCTVLFLNKSPFKCCFPIWKRVDVIFFFSPSRALQSKYFTRQNAPPLKAEAGMGPHAHTHTDWLQSSLSWRWKGFRENGSHRLESEIRLNHWPCLHYIQLFTCQLQRALINSRTKQQLALKMAQGFR